MRLQQRQARETGICPVRRELYSQCFGKAATMFLCELQEPFFTYILRYVIQNFCRTKNLSSPKYFVNLDMFVSLKLVASIKLLIFILLIHVTKYTKNFKYLC